MFFNGINWEDIGNRRGTPPLRPCAGVSRDSLSVDNFEKEFTSLNVETALNTTTDTTTSTTNGSSTTSAKTVFPNFPMEAVLKVHVSLMQPTGSDAA